MNQEIVEIVEIVEIGRGGVWVEALQQSACSSCNARSGCGQHSLSKLGRKMRLWVNTEQAFAVGEQTVLSLPEGSLAKSALVLYGLPMLSLLLVSLLGHAAFGEPGALVAGAAGLLLGLWGARQIANAYKDQWQPQFRQRCGDVVLTEVH